MDIPSDDKPGVAAWLCIKLACIPRGTCERSYQKHSDCGCEVHASTASAAACASGSRNWPEIRRGSRVSRRVARVLACWLFNLTRVCKSNAMASYVSIQVRCGIRLCGPSFQNSYPSPPSLARINWSSSAPLAICSPSFSVSCCILVAKSSSLSSTSSAPT